MTLKTDQIVQHFDLVGMLGPLMDFFLADQRGGGVLGSFGSRLGTCWDLRFRELSFSLFLNFLLPFVTFWRHSELS